MQCNELRTEKKKGIKTRFYWQSTKRNTAKNLLQIRELEITTRTCHIWYINAPICKYNLCLSTDFLSNNLLRKSGAKKPSTVLFTVQLHNQSWVFQLHLFFEWYSLSDVHKKNLNENRSLKVNVQMYHRNHPFFGNSIL